MMPDFMEKRVPQMQAQGERPDARRQAQQWPDMGLGIKCNPDPPVIQPPDAERLAARVLIFHHNQRKLPQMLARQKRQRVLHSGPNQVQAADFPVIVIEFPFDLHEV